MLKKISVLTFPLFLLSLHVNSYAVIAYIPHELRDGIVAMYEMIHKNNEVPYLSELYDLVKENRIITSDKIIRKGLQESLDFLKRNKSTTYRSNRLFKKYVKTYLNHLDDSCLLLAMNGSDNQRITLPVSLVAPSLSQINQLDIMCLSSMIATRSSLSLHGYTTSHALSDSKRGPRDNRLSDPGITFNANMMTNALYNFPNIMFGTGVSSPVINAWSMPVSNMMQSPINMQFPVPGNLKAKKAISLELHFLVIKHSSANGKVRIRVRAAYMDQSDDFNIFSATPSFSNTTNSDDFSITEPSSSDKIKHTSVIIPLENSDIDKSDLALLSLTRIEPQSGSEYAQDIYLAGAVFRYTD